MKLAVQAIANINVDFYDKKYILINAKQLDRNTRFLSITCYSHGALCPLNSGEHSAYVRYKKPDGYCVFNFCNIDSKGKILVELTEQMLAVAGTCYADLVVVNKGSAVVDENTGVIITIEDSGILSSMPFYVDVYETAFDNLELEVESSYEYDALNKLVEKAETEYSAVIRMAKSYAVGGTDERVNENIDNAKYYYEQSKKNATNAESFMNSVSDSAAAASKSAVDANTFAQNAQTYMGQAKTYMDNAQASATESAANASASKTSEINAAKSETVAQNSMNAASSLASAASESAIGAQNYYLQTEAIVNGLNGAFLPKGTITFAELIELKKSNTLAAGYLYNISDNFVTDDNFRMGSGVSYEAGTNVYFTADGQFDCLAGATVTGIKGNAESIYRKGNVNITPENIGAIPSVDIATLDEVKAFLGII